MKKAGESTREMEAKRKGLERKFLFICFGLLGVCAAILFMGFKFGGLVSCVISACVIFALKRFEKDSLEILDFLNDRQGHAEKGAKAEEKVGELLSSLDQGRFQIFHDLDSKLGNIDHLVLRRDGAIFIIETKSQGGEITWDGKQLRRAGRPFEKDFVAQTLGNVMSFREHLMGYAQQELWVTGVLCFQSGFVKGISKPIRGVQILPGKWLLAYLEKGRGNPVLADWLWEHMATLISLLPAFDKNGKQSDA